MKNRVLVFRDNAFAASLGIENTDIYMQELRAADCCEFCDAEKLKTVRLVQYDIFVSFYGAYFPKDAFANIEQFLKEGKALIAFNGMPFMIPCTYNAVANVWRKENINLNYIRRMNVHSVLDVDTSTCVRTIPSGFSNVMEEFHYLDATKPAQNLILFPTKDKYFEKDWGSAGSMDARITALMKAENTQGEHCASPCVLIENRAGAFCGGQWIIVTQPLSGSSDGKFTDAFQKMCNFLQHGYVEVFLRTSYPIYREGELPGISLSVQSYRDHADFCVTISVYNEHDEIVLSHVQTVSVADTITRVELPVPSGAKQGVYKVTARIEDQDHIYKEIQNGYLVGDFAQTKLFSPIHAGKDYFVREGKYFAVTGMTYMSGEVGRAFLHMPNTNLWLSEMQQMKAVGVNWIRTGIWTNWRAYMLDDGCVSEAFLRAIEAFVTCAAICDLHVTFTFFAFVPEMWEGSHPYLDPRSIHAQKRFISNIVVRMKEYNNIDWDLINEPYVHNHPMKKKRDDDTCERDAYRSFLREKYGSIEAYTKATGVVAQNFEELETPTEQQINFAVEDVSDGKNGLIWKDYILFCHKIFRDWALDMKQHIQKHANQMVTVGQDEALRSCRPVPMTYGDCMDYDAQHTWWLLQDLAWDTIFTKSYDRPLMVQETGIMYVENADSSPRRQEKDLQNLLRKKYAYAFATKSAGSIQWVWNSNYFLQSANESNIGALRCDGSYKPEVQVTKEFADFFCEAQPYLSEIRRHKIAVVFPFSNDFSNKRMSTPATMMLTKVLTNYLHVGFDGISEFQLIDLPADAYEIIIVPSSHNFSDSARKALLELAQKSSMHIIFTGPISLDENYQPVRQSGYAKGTEAIHAWETVRFNDQVYTFSFDNQIFLMAQKEIQKENRIIKYTVGKSELCHVNVPVEISREHREVARLYADLLSDIGYKKEFTLDSDQNLDGLFVSGIHWNDATLYTMINDSGETVHVSLTDTETGAKIDAEVEADNVEMFVLDQKGNVVVWNKKKNDANT